MQNLADLHHPPDTREHHVRMARFYWTTPRQTNPSKPQPELFA